MASVVSVVIPSFNYGRFLGRAIDSVLAQTYRHVECIVVDNGSTDHTPDVLASYADRVTILHESTKGPSAVRNAGIRAASGRYVAFLDADDFWLPEKLSRQVSLIETDEQIAVVGCRVQLMSAAGQVIGYKDFDEQASDPIDLVVQLRRIALRDFWVGGSASGALVRRGVFDAVGYWDETLHVAEDWDLWMRIGARFVVRNVPERLVSVCLHGTGTWRNADKLERGQRAAWSAAQQRWPELSGLTRRMHALILADAGGEYLVAGDTKTAFARYLSALARWPFSRARWTTVGGLALRLLRGR
jgi:glycosyltransferase involved in cell wall biosynthesis